MLELFLLCFFFGVGLLLGWSLWRLPRLQYLKPNDLIFRLRTRAGIRRSIATRRSVQEGAPDRISDLLEEAADIIENLKEY